MANEIHHTAIIGKNVKIGENVKIHPYVIIHDNVIIGNNVIVYSFSSVGTKPHHANFKNIKLDYYTIIGNDTTIRENVVIDSGTTRNTVIGSNCYIMCKSFIAHDVIIDDNTTVCSGVSIGGTSLIGKNCNIGQNASIHQGSHLNDYSMVSSCGFYKGTGMPGIIYIGSPAKPKKVNIIGIERANNLSEEQKRTIIKQAESIL